MNEGEKSGGFKESAEEAATHLDGDALPSPTGRRDGVK
jgi:hypothetical protein